MKPITLAFFCALAGCASGNYMYVPTEQATAASQGVPAARYDVPPEQSRGEVQVVSYGVADIDVDGSGDKPRFAHVRLIVSNHNDNGPWTVDTREQLLQLPGYGQSRAAFVNTDQRDAPLIAVYPRASRTLDLYYALPDELRSARRLPSFELAWQVQTATREVAQRTPFRRETLEPAYASTPPSWSVGFGWGPSWWYDPFYPSFGWGRSVVIHRHHPFLRAHPYHTPRWVGPPPGWHRRW